MDSHQPADPWGIPEGPTDDAEGVVATAPKESPNGHADHSDDTPAPELPEAEAAAELPAPEDFVEPPTDDVVADAETPVDVAEAEVSPEHEPVDEVAAESPEPIAEAPIEQPSDEGPRFDLGLDEDTSGTWGEPVGQFEAGTAFDLIPPSPDGEEAPQPYEVDEPDLSDAFVAASPEGRPDVGTPHLSDPDPLMAVPEETHPELSTEEPVSEPSSSFRLPGLFGRKKVAEDVPVEATPEDVVSAEDVTDEAVDTPAVSVEPADEPTDVPPMPTAWGSTSTEPSAAPDDPSTDEGGAPEPEDDVDEAPASDDLADGPEPETAEVGEAIVMEADEQSDESAESLVEDLENVLELPVAGVTPNEAPEGDDTMEIELTEPDLSEVIDAEQLYVTEDAHEDRPPALLTVDSVPGATIAQAVDVVTSVASAATEAEIADAMDRVLGQLRDKAHELGGEAVISVHTEVQEMGGGFLVTGSGTAVTLA